MSRTTDGLTTAIGVISGTSMDGIDVALIESDGEARVETGPAATFPYPSGSRSACAPWSPTRAKPRRRKPNSSAR